VNLFLGVYNPITNPIPLFNMTDDKELHSTISKNINLPLIDEYKWWKS
jgi:hypothetical protein